MPTPPSGHPVILFKTYKGFTIWKETNRPTADDIYWVYDADENLVAWSNTDGYATIYIISMAASISGGISYTSEIDEIGVYRGFSIWYFPPDGVYQARHSPEVPVHHYIEPPYLRGEIYTSAFGQSVGYLHLLQIKIMIDAYLDGAPSDEPILPELVKEKWPEYVPPEPDVVVETYGEWPIYEIVATGYWGKYHGWYFSQADKSVAYQYGELTRSYMYRSIAKVKGWIDAYTSGGPPCWDGCARLPPPESEGTGNGKLEVHAYEDGSEVEASVDIVGVGTRTTPFVEVLGLGPHDLSITFKDVVKADTVVVVESETSKADYRFTATHGPDFPFKNLKRFPRLYKFVYDLWAKRIF